MKFSTALLDLFRGALIGTAEVIPGVSGGTIALVVGLYDRLISSAANLVQGIGSLVLGKPKVALQHLRQVELKMLLPLGVGMVTALIIGASVIEPLLTSQPEVMRALFAGMILSSLIVPIQLTGKWLGRHYLLAAIGTGLAFALTSLGRSDALQPESWMIFGAAALAICALVLPGISGSFLLLAMGMYQPTIAAVNDRDLGYLGIFLLGAIAGLTTFALVLQWLLTRYHSATMATMTGLMVGSLRALWPWQSETGQVLAPYEAVPAVTALFTGGLVVAILILLERRFLAKGQ